VLLRFGRSLAALHFADDLAIKQRQQSVVVCDFLVHNPAVELVARLPEKIPANTQVKQINATEESQKTFLYLYQSPATGLS